MDEISEIRSNVRVVAKEVVALKERINKFIPDVTTKIDNLVLGNKNVSEETRRLADESKNMSGEIKSLSGKTDKLADDNKSMSGEIKSLSGKTDTLADDYKSMSGKIDELANDNKSMSGEIHKLELNLTQRIADEGNNMSEKIHKLDLTINPIAESYNNVKRSIAALLVGMILLLSSEALEYFGVI